MLGAAVFFADESLVGLDDLEHVDYVLLGLERNHHVDVLARLTEYPPLEYRLYGTLLRVGTITRGVDEQPHDQEVALRSRLREHRDMARVKKVEGR